MKFRKRISRFFYPSPDSPRWKFFLPYLAFFVILTLLFGGGVYGWEYTNSSQFCGTTCHTMPPQSVTFQNSPHANVTCEECHIGRASVTDQLFRKSRALHEIYYTVFSLYEYPIRATALQPARDTCEKCHHPETFSDDSLRQINRYATNRSNTPTSIYLIMKTGGGSARKGNARGIHWHISSKVAYYASDELEQQIPYVRVYNEDGSFTEYVDLESGFDPATADESQMRTMDCVTCHNRVTHNFELPANSMDQALSDGRIAADIPLIRWKGENVLAAQYESREAAMQAIAALEEDYKTNEPDYYAENAEKIKRAVAELQAIYDRTTFHEQKASYNTHPNNLGHMNAPGCFRCHDGKHLNDKNEAARLECNLCHAIPVVAQADDFLTTIEISRGPEPQSHFNPNWIALHNQAFNDSCQNCHTTKDAGGTSNQSFCSNSACHGNVFTYAGFDAPALREILKDQIPAEPQPATLTIPANPTFDNYVGALFAASCADCHSGDSAPKGLDLSSYAGAIKGGESGAAILPGDAQGSLLVKVQSASHFKKFTAEELAAVVKWINAGAPEK